jgi:hypothetical protein
MSDVERDELTTEQPVASDQEQQTQETGQSVQAEEGLQVPQKFLESSKIDVIQAYTELEKDRGRIANELGDLRKEREELEEKYRQLELQRMQTPQQPMQNQPTPQQVQPQQELDPLSVLRSKFADDPQAAIEEAIKTQTEMIQNQVQMQRLQDQSSKASDYLHGQAQENPDFARRVPAMQQLAQQYVHMVKPEYQNSVEMIKILDLASRGSDLDYYKKTALEEAQSHRAAVLEEKRRAQSVSSNSEGDASVDVSKMSNEDYLKTMQELYGYANKE